MSTNSIESHPRYKPAIYSAKAVDPLQPLGQWIVIINGEKDSVLTELMSDPESVQEQYHALFEKRYGSEYQIIDGEFDSQLEKKKSFGGHHTVDYMWQKLDDRNFIRLCYTHFPTVFTSDVSKPVYQLLTSINRYQGLYSLPRMREFPGTPEGLEKAKETFMAYLDIYHDTPENEPT